MISKRAFVDDNSSEVASKHQKHFDNEFVETTPRSVSPKWVADGEGDGSPSQSAYEARLSSDLVTCVSKESENGGSCSTPHYLWVNSCIIDTDVSTLLFPEFFEHTDHSRVSHHTEDVCISAVDHPPQKLVPVGPDHQAFVPEWDQQGSSFVDVEIEKMGTCVISIPNPELFLDCQSEEGLSRDDCGCLDSGSIRCARQHVVEAREKLREKIGINRFEDLGFFEMGEDVAKKWTEEEEHVFEEVVFANPASSGKNFWDNLSVAFPSRTRKDFVSYYFNVYVLRKRATQNRFDPVNVDSDNDEWQQSEHRVREDEDDSVVESPIDRDTPAYYQEDHLLECHENLGDTNDADAYEEGADVACSFGTVEDDGGDVDDASGGFIEDSPGNHHHIENNLRSRISNGEDCDIQDDSCTSYEYQQDRTVLCCPDGRESQGNGSRDYHVE